MGKFFPDRKIIAGGTAAILAFFITAAARHYGVELGPDAQTMLVAGIGGLISYIVPPSQRDIIKRLDDNLVKLAQDDPTIPVTKPKA